MPSNSAVARFQNAFIAANSAVRAQVLQTANTLNAGNAGVQNLLANLDLNDTSQKNRMKVSNIFFICAQLLAFDNFKF